MRKLWILLLALAVGLGAMLLLARTRQAEWTTSSSAALEEFGKGHAARMKLYPADAREHFRRALELDPDFVVAKLALMVFTRNRGERERLAEELEAADLGPLTAREQFLVRYQLARVDGRDKEAYQILKSFLAAYPEDPWGLDSYASLVWHDQKLDKAEKVYKKLIDVDPNWVVAQNRLAYIAMAQGRFEEAEDLLCTYQYIAPDQANPHDSMGELLTMLGRYDEARRELEMAVAIRPDFCFSYLHLVDVYILEGHPAGAELVLARAEESCDRKMVEETRCKAGFWADYFSGDLDAPWREDGEECRDRLGPNFLIHRMAVLSGRAEEALAIEERSREMVQKMEEDERPAAKHIKALLHHVRGVYLLGEGEVEEAVTELERADTLFYYWGEGQGVGKLYNRLNLAGAYELAGDKEKSRRVIEEVKKVNPHFATFYEEVRDEFKS